MMPKISRDASKINCFEFLIMGNPFRFYKPERLFIFASFT